MRYNVDSNVGKKTTAWQCLMRTLLSIKRHVDTELNKINICIDAIHCNNVNCRDESHRQELNNYCNQLIQLLLIYGDTCFPKTKFCGDQPRFHLDQKLGEMKRRTKDS